MKGHAGMHGDPRHHADDIAKLKAEVAELKAENQQLRDAVADLAIDRYIKENHPRPLDTLGG